MSAVPNAMWTESRRTYWLQELSSQPSGRLGLSDKHLHLLILEVPPDCSCICAGTSGMRHEATYVTAWRESKRRCSMIAVYRLGRSTQYSRFFELSRERVVANIPAVSLCPKNAALACRLCSERLGSSLGLRCMLSTSKPYSPSWNRMSMPEVPDTAAGHPLCQSSPPRTCKALLSSKGG